MIKLTDLLFEMLDEKKADRCKRIADRRYSKPSAYKSGAIVRCRQGKIWKDIKSEAFFIGEDDPEIESKDIQYTKPNFEYEWEEAIRYPEFKEMGKEKWSSLGNKGYIINYSDIEDLLGNVDLDFDSLEDDKKSRFKKSYKSGSIEYPIAVKFNNNTYDLIAGNTRLAGLVELGIDPKIWIIDLSHLNEAKKETLRTWFKRKGAPGKTGGWVDCNTCRKDPKTGKLVCKPCGRQKGEKRAKYPSCRPTPSQCKQPGKGKKWGKTK